LKTRISLGLRDERAEVGDHIAYFWENDREFCEGVRFLEVGLDGNDFCVIFGHDKGNERVRKTLQTNGYNLARLEREERLVTLGGHPDADQMLANIGAVFAAAVARGATLIRLLGNIGWGHDGWPAEQYILEFEAKVTGAAKMFPSVIVCMYDVGALPGSVVLHGAFETHPITFAGNVMRENPHYVDMEEFLRRLNARKPPAT
jgi:hypothetical protein